MSSSAAHEAAAEELAESFADPYLASRGLYTDKAVALDDSEARAALIHLRLQWEDDTREKGLTKLSFDALVRSVLRSSSPEALVARSEIVRAVQQLLPTTDADVVEVRTNAALKRLDRSYVRHYRKTDEYCLTHSERTRLSDRLAQIEDSEQLLRTTIIGLLEHNSTEELDPDELAQLSTVVKATVERLLLRKGELFVSAVSSVEPAMLDEAESRDIVLQVLTERPYSYVCADPSRLVIETVDALAKDTSPAVGEYLKGIADAYTLFAFLRETADVQSAVKKLFSHGHIWIDTNVIIPLLAETLEIDRRPMTELLRAATETGLRLKVTDGVVEEVESHLYRARKYVQTGGGDWRGSIPALLQAFVASGRGLSSFPRWTKTFRGDVRPQDDVADYLEEEHSIVLENLADSASLATLQVRSAVEEAWREIHQRRRGPQQSVEDLIAHDVENYLGVMMRRSSERRSDLGYQSWWLTLDRRARDVYYSLREDLGKDRTPPAPLMDPDFLAGYLSLGPLRSRVSVERRKALPIPLDIGSLQFIDEDLLGVAEGVRASLEGHSERVVRREVRDTIDRARRKAAVVGGRGAWREVFEDEW